jgi:hypothetical protein
MLVFICKGLNISTVEFVWNVMAHAQKPNFVFQQNGQVRLNRREHQFSRLLAAEVCASAVVMLDTPCSEIVWRVLATHSIRQFPLHFPTHASPCAITFQTQSTACYLDASLWMNVPDHQPHVKCTYCIYGSVKYGCELLTATCAHKLQKIFQ